jgi:hypothetical protein
MIAAGSKNHGTMYATMTWMISVLVIQSEQSLTMAPTRLAMYVMTVCRA